MLTMLSRCGDLSERTYWQMLFGLHECTVTADSVAVVGTFRQYSIENRSLAGVQLSCRRHNLTWLEFLNFTLRGFFIPSVLCAIP